MAEVGIKLSRVPKKQTEIPARSKPLEWWQHDQNVVEQRIDLSVDDARKKMKQTSLRWGILGLGRIARDFTTALLVSGSNVTAVAAGSLPRRKHRAEVFAQTYSIQNYYGSYEELAADPDVDIVYIATTNQLHAENTLLMLRAGKNVVVEKPMAMNFQEATAMANEARRHKRLLLTNFWTRFFPIIQYTRTTVRNQSIGTIMAMRGDFGFEAWPDSNDRFLNRTLGGGAMLDLGCYLVNIAVMVAGTSYANGPVDIVSTGETTIDGIDYGVDTEAAFAVRWGRQPPGKSKATSFVKKQAQQASANAEPVSMVMSGQVSFRRPSSFEVEIAGSHGRVAIHTPANAPHSLTISRYRPYGPIESVDEVTSSRLEFDDTYGPERYPGGGGFVHVIRAVEQCMKDKGIPGQVQDGCLELKELPMEEQLTTVSITDDILRKIGYWKS